MNAKMMAISMLLFAVAATGNSQKAKVLTDKPVEAAKSATVSMAEKSKRLVEKPGSHSPSSEISVRPTVNATLDEKLGSGHAEEPVEKEAVRTRKEPRVKYDCNKVPDRHTLIQQITSKDAEPGRIVVVLEQGEDRFDAKWDSVLGALGAEVIKRSVSNSANFLVVKLKNPSKEQALEFIENVSHIEGVRYAEPDIRYHVQFIPNDPLWSSQWGPQHINAPDAWDFQTGSMGIAIAIIDEGVQYTHPDLSARFSGLIGYDFVDDDADPMPDDPDEDHGTHVAGIAAATINNNTGIAGMAGGCRLVSLRALDETGSGAMSDLADAVMWAADQGFDILNMSWGSYTYSTTLENACNYAWNHGCLLVAASGNNGADSILYPARYASVIAVGAVGQDGSLASFSNYGPQQELVAPGVSIISTTYPDGYSHMDGTSMAAPHVSGVAALVWSEYPSMSNDELRDRLQNTADDRGASGWDELYGYGCVDAYAALAVAQNQLGSDEAVYITDDQNFVYNQTYIYWAAVGIRPDDGSDWDISLYEDTACTQFLEDSRLAGSSVDFVVRDYNHAPTGWEGVRVYRYAGSGGVTVEYEDFNEMLEVGSQSYTWPSGDVVEIFDIHLDPGTYTFNLTITSGNVDLGIGLYDSYNGPSDYAFDRVSLQHYSDGSGPGGSESFTVTLDHTDWYGVIVWANNAEGGDYTIEVSFEGTGLPELISDEAVTVTEDEFFFYEQNYIYWAVVGVRPAWGSDWDIFLYKDTTFADTSFLTSSIYAGSAVDFVVRDYNHAPLGLEGIEVQRFYGTGDATVEYEDDTDALSMGQNPDHWEPVDVVEIYDIYLTPGDYQFTLDVQDPSLDLGLALFDSEGSSNYAFGRAGAVESSDTAEAGGDEGFTVSIDHSDWFGVVVWSNNDAEGDYDIVIHTVGIDEDAGRPDLPFDFAMDVMPTSEGASVVKLALPHRAKVNLKIFDVSGRVVETVCADAEYEAGYHTITLPTEKLRSGIYLLRYEDDSGVTKTAKFVVLKGN